MSRRCTACGRAPSDPAARHDFCEYCAAPLEVIGGPSLVSLVCDRCGATFEAPADLATVLPDVPELRPYSHSMVAGGFDEMSYTTRLMPRTSLVMRLEILPSTS